LAQMRVVLQGFSGDCGFEVAACRKSSSRAWNSIYCFKLTRARAGGQVSFLPSFFTTLRQRATSQSSASAPKKREVLRFLGLSNKQQPDPDVTGHQLRPAVPKPRILRQQRDDEMYEEEVGHEYHANQKAPPLKKTTCRSGRGLHISCAFFLFFWLLKNAPTTCGWRSGAGNAPPLPGTNCPPFHRSFPPNPSTCHPTPVGWAIGLEKVKLNATISLSTLTD